MSYLYSMPYADEAQQRQAQREWWRAKYADNPSFRRKELRRKKLARASWSPKRKAKDRAYMREFMRRYRAKLKQEKTEKEAKLKKTVRRPAKPKGKSRTANPVVPRKPSKRASTVVATRNMVKAASKRRAPARRR